MDRWSGYIGLKDVVYRRSGVDRIRGLSLAVELGEWVCIAGPNGSGKSTLARLIVGLLAPTSGSISLGGVHMTPENVWDLRRSIGIVFANPDDQFVGLTVADDIAFGLENRQIDRKTMEERIIEVAQMLDLEPLLDRHPATLSGGQKQRAALAAVLAIRPSILIFDEAASMIDEQSKRELLATMRDMHKGGEFTLLSITHDMEEISSADRLILMEDGQIIADGAPADLLEQESLLARCRLFTPFALQLCQELQQRGIDLGEHISGQEVLEALWRYRSHMSPTNTAMEV